MKILVVYIHHRTHPDRGDSGRAVIVLNERARLRPSNVYPMTSRESSDVPEDSTQSGHVPMARNGRSPQANGLAQIGTTDEELQIE